MKARRTPKPTPRVPASLPRDLLLHCIRNDKRLDRALLSAPQPRWLPGRDEIRVTLYFDPEALL